MHILDVQRRLKDLGYDTEADGVINQKNRDAMRIFQERNGLSPTGLPDTETEAALLGNDAKALEAAKQGPPDEAADALAEAAAP